MRGLTAVEFDLLRQFQSGENCGGPACLAHPVVVLLIVQHRLTAVACPKRQRKFHLLVTASGLQAMALYQAAQHPLSVSI